MTAIKIPLNVVVVGHVDHGKSTLQGRLIYDAGLVKPEKIQEVQRTSKELGQRFEFAYFMDNVREEREDQMTIDVIYTPFETARFAITFIDAPGHRELARNMLTGASQADAAVLVVSAKPNEGIMEQTRRHLRLVDFLGIQDLIVVVNKMDAVGYAKERWEELKVGLNALVSSFGFDLERVPFVPISAREGDNVFKPSVNMPWYQGGTFASRLDQTFSAPEPLSARPLRFSVQDAYEVGGEPMIVGKVESGTLRVGQCLTFQPGGAKIKVTALKSFGDENLLELPAGEVAAVVPEFIVGETPNRGEVGGGESNLPRAIDEVESRVFALAEGLTGGSGELILRCGLAEGTARLVEVRERFSSETGERLELCGNDLATDDMAGVRLKLDSPMVIESFAAFPSLGRFTLKRGSKLVGVGIVA